MERRRWHATQPQTQPTPSLAQLHAELHVRLLTHRHTGASYAMRHLLFLQDEVERNGWRCIKSIPGRVIERALTQAEMLTEEDPSPSLTALVHRLRRAAQWHEQSVERASGDEFCATATQPVLAAPRVTARSGRSFASADAPDVTELSFVEFEQAQRLWAPTTFMNQID